ncbi:MAG: glycosyltransferase family 9 protein [Bdellovibrionota bacterium]
MPTATNDRPRERLVVQTAFLGDVLLSLPLIRAIKREWPDDRLVVLVRRGVGSYLRDSGLVDEVVEVEKSASSSWRTAKAALRSREFELVVCPHESFRSALFVSGLTAKKKVGFERFFNSFAFDLRLVRPLTLPESLRQLSLVRTEIASIGPLIDDFEKSQGAAGGQGPRKGELIAPSMQLEMRVPKLTSIRAAFESGGDWQSLLSTGAQRMADDLAVGKKPLVVLAPGSVWKTKMWTTEGFVDVAKSWISRGAKVAIFGSPDEAPLADEIARLSGATSIAGKTSLFESAELLALAELLVCNDSGAMHLGATAGTPTVGIFGPTILEFGYRPWNPRASVVQIDLDCRPCGKHGAKKCPLGTHACMKGISAKAVLSAADDLPR